MQLRAKVLLNNSCHEIMRTIDVVRDTRIVRSPGGNISFDNPSRSPFSSRVAGCLDKNVNRIQEFPNQRVISNFAFEIPAYFTNVLIDLEYKRFVPLLINEMGKYKNLLAANFLLKQLRTCIPSSPATSSASLFEGGAFNFFYNDEFRGYDGDIYQYTKSPAKNICRKFYTSLKSKERSTKDAPLQNGKMELLGINTLDAKLILNKVFSIYFARGLEEPDTALMQLGADSLVLAEVSRALSKELCTQVSVLDIFTCATFNELQKYIRKRLFQVSEEIPNRLFSE
jgi:acyl carrier protein